MAGLETTSAVNGNRILMGICLSYGVVSFCDTCRYHVFVLVALHSFSACGKMALNIGATAFLMLLFKPVWLFDVGFQLSFSAVAAILLLQPGLYSWCRSRIRFYGKYGGWQLFLSHSSRRH